MPTLVRFEPRETRVTLLDRARAALRSFTRPPKYLIDPTLAEDLYGAGARTAAGIRVTETNAYTFSAVYDAVNQISSDVGKLPLNLRKRRQDGGSDAYEESSLYWLFKREPNPEMSAMEFRRTLTAHALTCHGGYAEIERDGIGRAVNLWPLTPDRVVPFRDQLRSPNGMRRYGPLQYRIDGAVTLPARDIVHIHGLGYDGLMGYGVIAAARQAIGLGLAAEKFAGTILEQGSFGGLLQTTDDLDPDQQAAVRGEIEKYKQGWRQFLTLFGREWKYEKTSISSADAQVDKIRDQQIEEVARFFNMPLHKLKVNKPGAVSYASVEATGIDYLTGCLVNWLTTWEQELNRKLIPRLEMRQQFFKHNAAGMVRGDIKTRYEAYGALHDRGIINADDVREMEDMNPQEGGQGKMYLVQGAMVPKNLLVKQVEAKIKKDSTPKPAPTPPAVPPPTGERDDQILQELRERAERAEQASREALDQAGTAREALAAAEASGTAKDSEIGALRESEQRAVGLAAALTEQAAALRVDYQAALAAKEAAETAAAEQRAAFLADIDTARKAADEARALIASAEFARVAAEAQLTTAQAAEVEARAHAVTARELADTAMAERDRQIALADQAQQDLGHQKAEEARQFEKATAAEHAQHETIGALQKAESDLAAAQADVRAAITRAEMAEQAAGQSRAAADAAEGARTTVLADLESIRSAEAEARAALATATAALETLRATQAETAAEREGLRQQLEDVAARERLTITTAAARDGERNDRIAALEQTTAELRTAIEDQRSAESSGASAAIAAHRALVVDIMHRMVERESDRARRAQATPDKLRRWIETFYDGHEELLRAALLPAVRVHLAFVRSDDDPIEMTRRLVAGHVDESRRQLLTVLDGDADDLASSVGALMHRWESERPNTIADLLMQKELEHVRSR